MSTQVSEKLITPEVMAARFDGVEVSTVMDWNRKYEWPHVRVGHQVRWTEDQYQQILQRHTPKPAKKAAAGLPGQSAQSSARQSRAAS